MAAQIVLGPMDERMAEQRPSRPHCKILRLLSMTARAKGLGRNKLARCDHNSWRHVFNQRTKRWKEQQD